jgi:hypothetical protein
MTCPVSSLRLSVHAVATLGMTGQGRRPWRAIRARLTLIRASARGVSSRFRGAGEGSPPHRRSSPRLCLCRRDLRRAAGRLGRTRSRRCSETVSCSAYCYSVERADLVRARSTHVGRGSLAVASKKLGGCHVILRERSDRRISSGETQRDGQDSRGRDPSLRSG